MTVQLSYPGVYIEERESDVRTITGVATSVTAFVGRALRGPVDKALTITSYADFERNYGGLWLGSTLGYAVRDFYEQGGTVAVVVRLFSETANNTAEIVIGSGTKKLTLEARSPGGWGAKLKATIDTVEPGDDPSEFTITVTDEGSGKVEVFRRVSHGPNDPRRVDLVVGNESSLVMVAAGGLPTAAPAGAAAVVGTTSGGDDGDDLAAAQFIGAGLQTAKKGLYALEDVDLVNLIVIPPYTPTTVLNDVDATVTTAAIAYARRRRAMMILDPPPAFSGVQQAVDGAQDLPAEDNAVIYFPRIRKPDPLRDGQARDFAPAGAIAGVLARTDATRGVWKAPAGLDAKVSGVQELSVALTDLEIGQLNPLGINCLRSAPAAGHVVWGARTRVGNDRLASQWKYLSVRRTALFLEESLYRGTQWVVFEPNDAPLWAQIRLNVGAFMNTLFRQGAFAGTTPRQAYFVKCDAQTTTQDDVNLGIVNIIVGFAPLKPAEFVVVALQQMAGQTGGS